MASLAPRQERNQAGQTTVPRPGPGPVSSADVAAVQAAFAAAMAANDARQAHDRSWMDHPATAPAPSGDRGPAHESHSGYTAGPVFGTGAHPASSPPGEVWAERDRLPQPRQPAPAPVAVSGVRPAGEAGWWHARPEGPEFVLVSPDLGAPAPARRSGGGLLSRIKAWFKGGAK